MKVVTIGKLDRRIQIQEGTVTTNAFNEPVTTWATIATVWAKVTNRSGSESYQADQLTATLTTSFYIRYRVDIDTKMRVVYNNTVYRITSVSEPPDFRKQLLEVRAELVPEEEV